MKIEHTAVDAVTDKPHVMEIETDRHGLAITFQNGDSVIIDVCGEQFSIFVNEEPVWKGEVEEAEPEQPVVVLRWRDATSGDIWEAESGIYRAMVLYEAIDEWRWRVYTHGRLTQWESRSTFAAACKAAQECVNARILAARTIATQV